MKNATCAVGAMACGVCGVMLALVSYLAAGGEDRALKPAVKRPKLGVVVVFDQLRGDYLIKWKDLFGEGGFKRLQIEGAWFTDCHYPYSDTVTAAGHASMLTGCSPRDHGIIGNSWYERETGKNVQSITGFYGPDPLRRRRATLGDALLDQTKGKAKVAGLSIKERSAILMAALRAQIVYWLTSDFEFGTSRHYADKSRSWVKDFNDSGAMRAFVGQPWDRLRPRLDYQAICGPDNVKYENPGSGQGRTFPHPTPDAAAVRCSPFGNKTLLDFAKTAIEKESLGLGEVPDLLCVSFSSNDLVGHAFGPDSQEALDMTLQTDLIVKDLLDFLDAKVGKDNYFLALSADHGICPLPEAAEKDGKVAGRVLNTLLSSQAQKFLQKSFAPGKEKVKFIEATSSSWIYLDKSVIANHRLEFAVVEKTLAEWLVKQPGVERTFTRSQLNTDRPLDDPMAEQVRQSFHPGRSGDVTAILKPYHLLSGAPPKNGISTGTTHGSPYAYDTHVPLLVFGPGIRPGIHRQRVAPQAITPIIARGIGIDPPATAAYGVPEELFAENGMPVTRIHGKALNSEN